MPQHVQPVSEVIGWHEYECPSDGGLLEQPHLDEIEEISPRGLVRNVMRGLVSVNLIDKPRMLQRVHWQCKWDY